MNISQLFLFVSLGICTNFPKIYAQKLDNIKIYLTNTGTENVFLESLTFTDSICYYRKTVEAPYNSPKIKINKYKAFVQFVKENLTISNLSRIKNLNRGKPKKRTIRDQFYEYTLEFNYDHDQGNFSYELDYRLLYEEGNPEDQLVMRLNQFFEAFRREHGCSKDYFIHVVRRGETLENICQKYTINCDALKYFHYTQCRINGVEISLDTLKVGTTIFLPCLPIPISKYEIIEK